MENIVGHIMLDPFLMTEISFRSQYVEELLGNCISQSLLCFLL